MDSCLLLYYQCVVSTECVNRRTVKQSGEEFISSFARPIDLSNHTIFCVFETDESDLLYSDFMFGLFS